MNDERKTMTKKKWILIAERNASETERTLHAFASSYAPPEVVVARDGVEVLDCLYQRNGFEGRPAGQPAVVLLDLETPSLDGWEILRQMKGDSQLKTIPVVVFTDSREAGDLVRSYQLGANAYIVKPAGARQLAAVLEEVRAFWIVINESPREEPDRENSKLPELATAA